MKTFRRVLWAVVVVVCAMIVWLVYEIGKTNEEMMNIPFGPKFALTDSNGDVITEAALREKPTALFFGFTHCPEVCPTTLYELNGWLHEVDPKGDKMNAYWVSVDPERDTPDIMNLYLSNVSDRIVGISGDPDAVRKAVDGFGIYYERVPLDPNDPNGDYTMNHNAAVFLLDNGGVLDGTIAYGENPDVAVQKLENIIN